MQDIVSEDLHKYPKRFWSYFKSRKQESSGITSLKNKDGYLHSDTVSKADILNKQFHSVYTKEDYANMPDKGPSPYPSMMKIKVNNQGVVTLLRGLRPFKATGPDEIPAFGTRRLEESQHCPSLQERREAYSIQLPTSATDFDRLQILEHIVHSSIMDHFARH
jgi:hypothetical protein